MQTKSKDRLAVLRRWMIEDFQKVVVSSWILLYIFFTETSLV